MKESEIVNKVMKKVSFDVTEKKVWETTQHVIFLGKQMWTDYSKESDRNTRWEIYLKYLKDLENFAKETYDGATSGL